ncbi:MAG: Hint domain-containing protein [Ruegeria sp.]|uniref:Hint domain-containing protein n=1 Tax=Ruegeria sp. TaxID=1879320 RepID=UPI00349E4B8D
MPNINGTGSADNIDVTDDNGTLNGTPQGTPINNIRARGGNDTVTVTNSTISGTVRGNGGADDITVTGSTVGGSVNAGSGSDTVSIQGSNVGNIRLGGGNDTLDLISTTVTGDVQGGNGTDTLNLPTGTVVNDATFGTFTVSAGVGYSLSSGTFTLPSGTVITYSAFENGTGFPCFTRDTLIRSGSGAVSVQDLRVGDQVATAGNGPQPIRWIGRRRFELLDLAENPKLRPVRILAGALGHGLPQRDLLVSRQHRMLVRSKIAQRMFGAFEVLIPAIKLTALPGVFVDASVESVEYYHLLFDRHEIVFAEGAPSESLYTGPEALDAISSEARREIFGIFPELVDLNYEPPAARYIPRGRQQARLVARHLKNNKPLLSFG